jgi:membrane protease YdiL (CAAX protease family)
LRAILYIPLAVGATVVLGLAVNAMFPPPPGPSLVLKPSEIALAEGVNLLAALIATALFAWYEHRRVDSYGLPLSKALALPTWEGFGVGVVQVGVVAAAMLALDGMQVHGLALSGAGIAISALSWLGACLLVGVGEEMFLRGYFLQTLWKAVGFWPATAVIAVLFAGVHYLFKPGENVWDMIALVSFSVLCCYSVLRTGTLWFAVGLHVAYDFMQLFVIGTPNGGHVPIGRLLNATFNGPAWLTGGPLGTEASWIAYLMDAFAFLYLWLRFRNNRDYTPA